MAKKKGKDDAEKGAEEAEGGPAAAKASPDEYTGPRLRSAREQKGLSVAEISERTKISKAVLSALEDERYEDMPNARVYVRGFVRCVARELGLDLDAVTRGYLPRWERWVADQPERY